jgi:hypothetical protein
MPKLQWFKDDMYPGIPMNNRKRITADMTKAMSAVPESFKEPGSGGQERLNEDAIQAMKGDPEYRFDDMNELFVVEYKGTYGDIQTGLFYVTSYQGFGTMKGVLILNTDGNGYMYGSNGYFGKGDREREYNFFRIKAAEGGKRTHKHKRTRKHRKQRKHRKHTRKH